MKVRRAEIRDIEGLLDLLKQVNLVHHLGRSDLFNIGTKYTSEELASLINNEETPIFVAIDDDCVVGHGFCMVKEVQGDNILVDHKSIYIDDICVDQNHRRMHIGEAIYEAIKEHAKNINCYNITLNVWSFNEGARNFYESLGMKEQKRVMEEVLSND